MPKKVPFKVVHCTGWEDNYPAKNLEVQNPFVKGWRSPRYCLYPQELLLRVDRPMRIRKIQLLSHQYMIASKIELFVGGVPLGQCSLPDRAQFTRLGYVSFTDNEQTGFRSRELKSVNLDIHGQLVRLVLHQNHVNRLNLFNQVGVVALNVIADSPIEQGEEGGIPSHVTHFVARQRQEELSEVVHSYLPSYRASQDADPVLLGAINKPVHISPMDDLAFAISQDPETASLIQRLETKKLAAVKEEKFDFAKQLKQIITELQKIGEVLCRYEVEKKLAIEREDYDTAKERKLQADKLRHQVYQQLGIQSMVNGGAIPAAHHGRSPLADRSHPRVRNPPFAGDSEAHVQQPAYSALSPPRHAVGVKGEGSPKRSPRLPPIGPLPSKYSPQHAPSYDRPDINDERPLPALVKKSQQQLLQEQLSVEETMETDYSPTHVSERVHSPAHMERPEPLTDKQLNEVQTAVDVFGLSKVTHIFAKQFSLREKGLQMIHESLTVSEAHSRRALTMQLKAVCQVLHRALRDTVFSAYSLALDLLRYLTWDYCNQHKLGRPELSFIIDKTLPVLLDRGGDMAPRIRSAAMDAVLELHAAQQQRIKGVSLIASHLVKPFKQHNTAWRLAKSRVELLDRFLQDVGMKGAGLTVKDVMAFINPCLEHTNGEVRDMAIKITMDLYKLYGPEVRSLLPVSDSETARKKTFWKTIFEGFDSIDGVPNPEEIEAAEQATERAKKDEINKLQTQLVTLRKLAANARGQSMTEEELSGALQSGGTASTSAPRVPRHNRANLENTCVFCGEKREGFTDSGLEPHYLTECPMLQQCKLCTQMVEVSQLTTHWLEECESKDKFCRCPRCKEAIQVSQYDDHVTAESCPPAPEDGSNRCPLCHSNIPSGDEGWKSHLMDSVNSCVKNPRGRRKPGGRGIPRAVPPAKRRVHQAGGGTRRHK